MLTYYKEEDIPSEIKCKKCKTPFSWHDVGWIDNDDNYGADDPIDFDNLICDLCIYKQISKRKGHL